MSDIDSKLKSKWDKMIKIDDDLRAHWDSMPIEKVQGIFEYMDASLEDGGGVIGENKEAMRRLRSEHAQIIAYLNEKAFEHNVWPKVVEKGGDRYYKDRDNLIKESRRYNKMDKQSRSRYKLPRFR